MTALTHDRNTPRREAFDFSFPVAAGKRIFTGATVVIQADGYAAPGSTATQSPVTGGSSAAPARTASSSPREEYSR